MSTSLSKTESTILVEAAGREGGRLALPESMKPVSRQRLLGKLESQGLIAAAEGEPVLTAAGYRAVGLRPLRARRSAQGEVPKLVAEAPRTVPGAKQAAVLELLGRAEGASLAELVAATGWLPHTTRAALSRLRSAGKPLAKAARQDGTTAYRLLPPEPAPERCGRKRKGADSTASAVAA